MGRVLRNISGLTVTIPNGSVYSITTVRELRIDDRSQFQAIGSDNAASPTYYLKWFEAGISLIVSDPIAGGLNLIKGFSNCNLFCQAIDINTLLNVNVSVTGAAFGQPGLPEKWGEVIDVPINSQGGAVSIIAA